MAPTYADYVPGPGGSGGQYIWGSYVIQPQARDCRYDVVEHAHPSWNVPDGHGFIISAGICEDDLPIYERQRKAILDSFNEME